MPYPFPPQVGKGKALGYFALYSIHNLFIAVIIHILFHWRGSSLSDKDS
jgi:hypothetical protein